MYMKNTQQLIKNVIGQLNGILNMIEEGKDCDDIIIQFKAVKSALNNSYNKFIEDNALTCLTSKNSVTIKDKNKIKNLINEIIKNN